MSNTAKHIEAEQLATLLEGVVSQYEEYADEHPTLRGLISQTRRKAEALRKPEAEREVKRNPVVLTYTGEEILVAGANKAGINFWKMKYGLDSVLGIDTGKTVDKPGSPYHGNTIHKSSFDKKRDMNVFPAEKKDALLSFFESLEVPVVEQQTAAS